MRYRTTVSPPWLAALPQRSAPIISAEGSVSDVSTALQYGQSRWLTAPHSHRDHFTIAPNAALCRGMALIVLFAQWLGLKIRVRFPGQRSAG
jgi:hypothetical protein